MTRQQLTTVLNYLTENKCDFNSWSYNELDALYLMLKTTSLQNLLNNFKCSIEELQVAVKTQLICAGWSIDTDPIQHFATFMLSGHAPMSQYVISAIRQLSNYINVVKRSPTSYDNDEVENLQLAINFLNRYET